MALTLPYALCRQPASQLSTKDFYHLYQCVCSNDSLSYSIRQHFHPPPCPHFHNCDTLTIGWQVSCRPHQTILKKSLYPFNSFINVFDSFIIYTLYWFMVLKRFSRRYVTVISPSCALFSRSGIFLFPNFRHSAGAFLKRMRSIHILAQLQYSPRTSKCIFGPRSIFSFLLHDGMIYFLEF